MARRSLKMIENIVMLLLRPIHQKLVDYLNYNKRLNFLKKCDLKEFWSYLAQKSILEETLKTDCEKKIFDNFCSEAVKRRAMNGVTISYRSLYQNNSFTGKERWHIRKCY